MRRPKPQRASQVPGKGKTRAAFVGWQVERQPSWVLRRRALGLSCLLLGVAWLTLASSDLAGQEPATNWPSYVLEPELVLPLQPPSPMRFDASALLWHDGGLLTLRDQEPTLYRIAIQPGASTASLVAWTNCFSPEPLKRLGPGGRLELDCEGLAQDTEGRLYLCDEVHRWILRCDPRTGHVERLAIDWTPVTRYFRGDRNASFEGLAVGKGRLYVANERSAPVIIVVDLASLKVVEHFVVIPRKASLWGTHYSDLGWWGDRLYVLCRQHQVVLEVDPGSHAILAEFDYAAAEDRLGYGTLGLVGLMEGLAVHGEYFWLVTDNNGLARQGTRGDTRPVLLKCPRPDRQPKPAPESIRAGQSR